MSIPKGLAARAVLKTVGSKQLLYIEVREDRKFADFYYTCTVIKKGRRNVITSSAPRHRGFAASLEEATEKIAQTMKKNAKQIQKVNLEVHITVRIYRKRLYRKLLALRPDELGLAHVSVPAQRTTVSPVAYIQQLQTATR